MSAEAWLAATAVLANWIADRLISFQWPILIYLIALMFKSDISEMLKKGITVNKSHDGVVATLGAVKELAAEQLRVEAPSDPVVTVPAPSSGNEVVAVSATQQRDAEEIQALRLQLESQKERAEFEKIYGAIFGSQIELLQSLAVIGSAMPMSWLGAYFDDVKSKNPVFASAPWSLIRYLQFLFGFGLIEASGADFLVSAKGARFISWLAAEQKPPRSL